MPLELPANLLAAIERNWGFTGLRPLQTEAIRAVLANRDSLVVLPRGAANHSVTKPRPSFAPV